jgi:hypothetical protein
VCLLASGGPNLNKKLSEVIRTVTRYPRLARSHVFFSNVVNVRSFRGSMVDSARGLEFSEDESGNVLLNEDGKLSPNEAICADKRAYSRAVLVYTEAVALLQHPA